MTRDDMRGFARSLLDGGKYTRAEIMKFMQAFWELALPDVDIQAGGSAMTKDETVALLPTLSFEIEKTETGIHVPREANRAYNKREAAALLAAIAKALE